MTFLTLFAFANNRDGAVIGIDVFEVHTGNRGYAKSHDPHEHDDDQVPETRRLVKFFRKMIENSIEFI